MRAVRAVVVVVDAPVLDEHLRFEKVVELEVERPERVRRDRGVAPLLRTGLLCGPVEEPLDVGVGQRAVEEAERA